MVPWIQVYSNILTHDKTYALAEALGVENYSAVGLMVSLWSWAAINAPDGNITAYPPMAIEEATGFRKNINKKSKISEKKSEDFFKILLKIRLIECVDGNVFIRNWDQYASLLTDMYDQQKKKTAERVNRYRSKKKALETKPGEGIKNQKSTQKDTSQNENCNAGCNVTETLCNGSTKPNLTIPNHIDNTVVVGVSARARENDGGDIPRLMSYYCEMIGTLPPPQVCASIEGYLDHMEPAVIIDAIDIAAGENKRSWSYINGILKSRKASGVRNMADAARVNEEWKKSRSAKGSGSPQKASNPFYEMLKEEDDPNDKNRYETIDGNPESRIPELLQGHPG